MITNFKRVVRHLAAATLPFSLAFISVPNAKALGVPNRTRIPFSFTVGSQQMPAGEYNLTRVFFGNVYSLTNLKNGKTVMISLPANAGTRPGQLVFKTTPHGYSLKSAQ
jgi:hypothetical protein